MRERSLLTRPRLTIVSGEPDFELRRIAHTVTDSVMVDGRMELEELLSDLLIEAARCPEVVPKTLDLIGHTRTNASLLALGQWIIDAANPTTTAFFRELADHDVLPRLGVYALRLLGCNSAGSAQARATIRKLGELLGLEVYGTKQLLHDAHYGTAGFRDCWSFLLVAASELRDEAQISETAELAEREHAHVAVEPYARVLDVDGLPAVALGPSAIPRRIATTQAASEILQLVRRHEGAVMPGLHTVPSVELALPAAAMGEYYVAHVVLGGEFLRFYPDGMTASGIVFPVEDADALGQIIATLLPDPYVIH